MHIGMESHIVVKDIVKKNGTMMIALLLFASTFRGRETIRSYKSSRNKGNSLFLQDGIRSVSKNKKWDDRE